MENAALVLSNNNNNSILIPQVGGKAVISRITIFCNWLNSVGGQWWSPNLGLYRDYLLNKMSPVSVASYISTCRSRYNEILIDNDVRDRLYNSMDGDLLERKAKVEEILARLQNALHPSASKVKVIKTQDEADDSKTRLNQEQIAVLLSKPDTSTLVGLRDLAIISLMLSTGIREAELCDLNVEDLRQRYGGALALHVRQGKGNKARLVPYGDLVGCLTIVGAWLDKAGVKDGAVFRGLGVSGTRLSDEHLSERTIQRILDKYAIDFQGTTVHPHDLRRSYAKLLYDNGSDLMMIMLNLGHNSMAVTQKYIGNLTGDQRSPRVSLNFEFDASKFYK